MTDVVEQWQALTGPTRMVTTVFSSWLFFFASSLLVSKTSMFECPAKGQEWVWKNRWISWQHAAMISVLTLYSFFSCVSEFWHDTLVMVDYHSFMMQLTLAVSIGYFLHDLTDNLVYTFNGSLEGIAVLAHHLVAIIMFGIFTWMDHYCCFIMLAIATEVNSVFLHQRKLLQLAGYEITDQVYIVNNVVNVVTFLVFRVGGQLYMKYLIVLVVPFTNPMFWGPGLAAMVSLQIVNVALANSLFVSDVKRWRKLQQLRRASDSGEDEATSASSSTPLSRNGHDLGTAAAASGTSTPTSTKKKN
ncbi:TLC domain-containing protein 2-like [Sycon ciliatum]|uniref:TLC domain-containing protein 2-like n=1 Tax=Sycon ciliatum TaxID=27933 RepID=UPI0031F6D972